MTIAFDSKSTNSEFDELGRDRRVGMAKRIVIDPKIAPIPEGVRLLLHPLNQKRTPKERCRDCVGCTEPENRGEQSGSETALFGSRAVHNLWQ